MSAFSSFFKRRKKYSIENLNYQCTVLEKNRIVNLKNKALVVETLRVISELMIYGDQNDESFFYILAEKNILGHFLAILKQNFERSVNVQVYSRYSYPTHPLYNQIRSPFNSF